MIRQSLRQSVLTYIRRGIQYASGLFPKLKIPLTSTGVPSTGAADFTFSRSTAATVIDFEGQVITTRINELRFPGARRVYNRCVKSEPTSGTGFSTVTSGITFSDHTWDGLGFSTAVNIPGDSTDYYLYQLTAGATLGRTYILSVYVEISDGSVPSYGTGSTKDLALVGGNTVATLGLIENISGNTYRIQALVTPASSVNNWGVLKSAATRDVSISVTGIQIEEVTGSQIKASEYVSVGVLSWPYHGAGVDGVKYFLTDRNGNAISPSGALVEPISTNLFLNSSSPATQSITVVNGSSYTVWGTGSGSVVLSGAGSGTVTSSSPRTFTATSTTLTCTVTNMSTVQVELGVKTSYIPTSGTAVTRTADIITYDVSSALSQGQGSIYSEFLLKGLTSSTTYILSLDDATSSNSISLYISSGTTLNVIMTSSGSSTVTSSLVAVSKDSVYKIMITYENNSFNVYINGTLILTDTSCTVPTVTYLRFAKYDNSGQTNIQVKDFLYYKEVLNQSEAERRTS